MIKPIKKTSESSRRKYDEVFKSEAVNNWLASGKSAQVIAQELGIKAERLYSWKKRFAPATAGGRAADGAKAGSPAALQAQLDAALREVRHLRQQRDILKKTLGILSEPPTTASNGFTP
jgi:transposase-like protein